MSIGRTEVNGSFQVSEYREPGAVTANDSFGNCARFEVVKGRGKGAMTITMHTDSGAQVNLVVQLSSEIEKKLVLIVAREESPAASSVLNQLNKVETESLTIATINVASDAVITKFSADIQGKLDSASVSDVNDLLFTDLNNNSADLYPAGFSDNTVGSTLYDKWVNMRGATYGHESEMPGKVIISAPGRGHVGTIRSL